ncbi:MAG: hypothetical protein R3324_20505, partial [Halobacteriales archaeon]|nr:hypothetical protein [Halobacteriales archaeon]
IEELYPPQEEAVERGVTAGESVVASVPTASGKTLIAELAMLSAVERGAPAADADCDADEPDHENEKIRQRREREAGRQDHARVRERWPKAVVVCSMDRKLAPGSESPRTTRPGNPRVGWGIGS